MKLFLILIAFSFLQEQVPFKAADEFQVNIDLKFIDKPSGYNTNTFSGSGDRLDTKKAGMQFPFLKVNISQLKIREDEEKIIAIDSKGKQLLKKKTSPIPELRFDMGFIDDLKNNDAANEINVFFLSKDKKELRKIVFQVLPSGVFTVNGQWHGQF